MTQPPVSGSISILPSVRSTRSPAPIFCAAAIGILAAAFRLDRVPITCTSWKSGVAKSGHTASGGSPTDPIQSPIRCGEHRSPAWAIRDTTRLTRPHTTYPRRPATTGRTIASNRRRTTMATIRRTVRDLAETPSRSRGQPSFRAQPRTQRRSPPPDPDVETPPRSGGGSA